MSRGIQRRLAEIQQAGETDDSAVDLAEGLEAEDFGGVVGDGGVVERAIEDEEGDAGVGGSGGGDEA